MTTVTLTGIYVDFVGDGARAVGPASLNVVVPRADSGFTYRVIATEEGLPEVELSDSVRDASIDAGDAGFYTLSQLLDDPTTLTMMGTVRWRGGETVIFGIGGEIGPNTQRELYIAVGGSDLPAFGSAAAFSDFEDRIQSISVPGGAFAPGQTIRWRDMPGARISQDDEFYGGPGRDVMSGGIGDDFFNSTPGTDRYIGGTGFDQISFARDPAGVIANLTSGRATDGWGNQERLSGIEMLRGSAFDDQLIGNAATNHLRGLAGDDTLDGRGGRDLVRYDRDANYGGTGGATVHLGRGTATDGFGDTDTLIAIEDAMGSGARDRLTGSRLANTLAGEGGNDILAGLGGRDHLIGARGADKLDGGRGADRLQGDQGSDTFIFKGRFGNDRILDFGTGNDKIDLRGVAPIISFNDLMRNHVTVSGDNLRIADGNGNTILLLDVGRSDLAADDFLF